MKLPYGVADFYSLRTQDYVYVDRTDRIAVVEDLGKSLLFLRPRRFGKSLWLSTLASYYDLRRAGEHERLFGDLAIGKTPTPLAHRYFVMRWDFSKIDPDPPPWGVNANVSSRYERIGNEIRGYLNTSIEIFLIDYREHLPERPRLGDDPFHNFERLLATIRQTPYRLYLLIDEYDNFANEIVAADADVYHDLVQSDGPFKYLFKWVKGLTAGDGLERLFVTGVSPMVMSDVTSGMNIARNVYLKPALADLCGFTDGEVDGLLAAVLRERSDCELGVEDTKLMMREWYNGYRFALKVPERTYNPTLVFYFLLNLLEEGSCPRQMLDANLAADEGDRRFQRVRRRALTPVIEHLAQRIRESQQGGRIAAEVHPYAAAAAMASILERLAAYHKELEFFGVTREHLVETCADRLWLVADRTVTSYDGDMDEYAELILSRARASGRGNGKSEPKTSRKEARRDAAAARAKIAPLRRKVEAMEKRHEKLQLDLAAIEASINDPALYEDLDGNTEKLSELTKRQADLTRNLKDAEFEWMKALDAYEKAEAGMSE